MKFLIVKLLNLIKLLVPGKFAQEFVDQLHPSQLLEFGLAQ